MITALVCAALLAQANGAPHFSEDPDAVSTPGAAQAAAPAAKTTNLTSVVKVVAPSPASAQGALKLAGGDPVSCQTVEVTGTRFGSKRCLTKSQWEQQARDGKDLYEQLDFKGGWGMAGGH